MGIAGEVLTSTTDAAVGGAAKTPIDLIRGSCMREPLSLFFKFYDFLMGIPEWIVDILNTIPFMQLGDLVGSGIYIIAGTIIIIAFVLIGLPLTVLSGIRQMNFDLSSMFSPQAGVANTVQNIMGSGGFNPILTLMYLLMTLFPFLVFFNRMSFATAATIMFILGAIEGASLIGIPGVNTMYALGFGLFAVFLTAQPIGFLFYLARFILHILPMSQHKSQVVESNVFVESFFRIVECRYLVGIVISHDLVGFFI